MKAAEQTFQLHMNGSTVEWDGDPTTLLVDVIREHLALTGTKVGCRTGECGACTVVVDGQPMLSCLVPTASVAGREVVTVEGLREDARFQKLVGAMEDAGGSQCGYCTPGIMVTLWGALENHSVSISTNGVAGVLKNNLCRCTGYQSILIAAEKVIQEVQDEQSK